MTSSHVSCQSGNDKEGRGSRANGAMVEMEREGRNNERTGGTVMSGQKKIVRQVQPIALLPVAGASVDSSTCLTVPPTDLAPRSEKKNTSSDDHPRIPVVAGDGKKRRIAPTLLQRG